MINNQDNIHIDKSKCLDQLLVQIELQLGWESAEDWSSADFDKLSDLIFEESQQRLSVTTLKRIWGRTSQTVNPSVTTLDILSKFAGTKDWRDFKLNHASQDSNTEKRSIKSENFLSPYKKILYILGLVIVSMVGLTSVFYLFSSNNAEMSNADALGMKLEIFKVSQDIPNTVIFKYDVGNIEGEKFELQQSWDKRKRILLDPLDSLVTTSYYEPGYFKVKIVVDDQIVKTENLYLPSDGFNIMSYFQNEDLPRRYSSDHFTIREEGLKLGTSFDSAFTGLKKESFLFVNLLENPTISADSFGFRIKFKMQQDEEGNPCNPMSIIITGQEDVYKMGIGHPGCSSDLDLYLGGDYITGKNVDLSYLGFKEEEMVDYTIAKTGNKLILSVSDTSFVLSEDVNSIGKIGGVKVFSRQEIEIRILELFDTEKTINLLVH